MRSARRGRAARSARCGRSARRACGPRDRVDELEVARVRHRASRRSPPLGVCRVARMPRWYFTSPVPPSAVGGDGLDRPLALELAQDRVVRAPDDVGQHVQPAAVRHADARPRCAPSAAASSIASSSIGTSRSSPSMENCFWPRKRLRRYASKPSTSLRRSSRRRCSSSPSGVAVAARLDRLAQPHALLVVVDVLDLVGDRAAVGLVQPVEHVLEGVSRRRRRAAPTRGSGAGAPA